MDVAEHGVVVSIVHAGHLQRGGAAIAKLPLPLLIGQPELARLGRDRDSLAAYSGAKAGSISAERLVSSFSFGMVVAISVIRRTHGAQMTTDSDPPELRSSTSSRCRLIKRLQTRQRTPKRPPPRAR